MDKNTKITVMQLYQAMFTLFEEHYETLTGEAWDTFGGLLGEITIDNKYYHSMDPACWSDFAYFCSEDENEAKETDQITVQKGYHVIIDFLENYHEPWPYMEEDKKAIIKLINLLETDKSYWNRYLDLVQSAIDGKITNAYSRSFKEKFLFNFFQEQTVLQIV